MSEEVIKPSVNVCDLCGETGESDQVYNVYYSEVEEKCLRLCPFHEETANLNRYFIIEESPLESINMTGYRDSATLGNFATASNPPDEQLYPDASTLQSVDDSKLDKLSVELNNKEMTIEQQINKLEIQLVNLRQLSYGHMSITEVQVHNVIDAVAKRLNITKTEFLRTHKEGMMDYKHIIRYILNKEYGFTYKRIAKLFCIKHPTVGYSIIIYNNREGQKDFKFLYKRQEIKDLFDKFNNNN